MMEKKTGNLRTKLNQKVYDTNQMAMELERVVNEILKSQKEPVRTYYWDEIAEVADIPRDTVATLGRSIDGGSGGFTAYRHDLGYNKSLELSAQGSQGNQE